MAQKVLQKSEGQSWYQNARTQVKVLEDKLCRGTPAFDSTIDLLDLMTHEKDRRIVLYLGAGCSSAVRATDALGKEAWKGLGWVDLLETLFDRAPDHERMMFIQSLNARLRSEKRESIEKIEDLFRYFDKLRVAWFLTQLFDDFHVRDDKITDIVQPPRDSKLKSPLLEAVLALPFDDIITTNYDDNIEKFLSKNVEFESISKTSELKKLASAAKKHRLFHLHGRALDEEADRRLIFDRLDYAWLQSEHDGIFDYVTYLLRDSHVVYVGFSLDDPTFNLMETRLYAMHNPQRPLSFAFMDWVTEKEREAWRGRNLRIIDYRDNNFLPDVIRSLNCLVSYFKDREPHRAEPVGRKVDRTRGYLNNALEQYVQGNFVKSRDWCRMALASTLFWERDDTGNTFKEFDQAVRMCDIRIRLALNYYKLQLSTESDSDGDVKGQNLIRKNLDRAREIISAERGRKREGVEQGRLLALENSWRILDARDKYHCGKITKSLKLYGDVVSETHLDELRLEGETDKQKIIWKLRLAEAYYYARCQMSRLEYHRRSRGLASRPQETEDLKRLQQDIKERFYEPLEEFEQCKTDPEWKYYRDTFATLMRIAGWTAGRHCVSCYEDVIPMTRERGDDTLKRLEDGIRLLEQDPLQQAPITPAPRWNAMRYRYLGRAYATQWLVRQLTKPRDPSGADQQELSKAYAHIQTALEEARKPGLERQEISGLLEAARLCIVVMFGTAKQQFEQSETGFASSLGYVACAAYLDAAYRGMAAPRFQGNLQRDLRIEGAKLASYFSAVSVEWAKSAPGFVKDETLQGFLRGSLDDMVAVVEGKYKEFASRFSEPAALNRIEPYKNSLREVQDQIAQWRLPREAA